MDPDLSGKETTRPIGGPKVAFQSADLLRLARGSRLARELLGRRPGTMRVTTASIFFILFFATTTITQAAISGRVLGTDARPLAGAQLAAYAPETREERAVRVTSGRTRTAVATAVAALDGTYRLTSPLPVVDVLVTGAGLAPAADTLADGAERTFVLRAAAAVRARVEAGGRPVAGAALYWQIGATSEGSHELELRSGSDGSYELPAPEAWAAGVVVTHPDFAPAVDAAALTSSRRPPRHELVPGVGVEGRVVDAAGRGVAGASLEVDGWPLGRSGADGAFAVRHAPVGWSTLEARDAGTAGTASPRAGRILVRVEPLRRLSGAVRDRRSGVPIASARVALASGGRSLSALTDGAGRYRIDAPVGRYYATISRPGYSTTLEGTDDAEAIDLSRAPSLERDFRIAALLHLRGRVEDETRRPVPGALVRLVPRQAPRLYSLGDLGGAEAGSAWSGADGAFTLEVPADEDRSSEWTALALKPGYALAVLEAVKPGEAAATLAFTLTRGVALAGRVTSQEGEPVAGAAVVIAESAGFPGFLGAPADSLADAAWMRSAADGTFTTRVRATEHELVVLAPGRSPRSLHGHNPSDGAPLQVVLDPAVEIRGRVAGANATGVEGLQVYAWRTLMRRPATAATDADGSFALSDLSAGSYQLQIFRDRRPLGEARSVEAPASDLRIDLEPAGRLQGRVVDARTHEPLARFEVTLERASRPDDEGVSQEFPTGAAGEEPGRFTLLDVPYGDASLSVRAPGFVERRIEGLTLGPEAEPAELEVALEPGVTLRGRVTSEDGGPLAEASVTAGDGEDERLSAESNARGEYELEGIAPGRAVLQFSLAGFRTARRSVDAAEGTRLDVVLTRGVAVSGVVTAEGKGVAKAYVQAQSAVAGAESSSTTTDRAGRFTLAGLSPGRYTVTARGSDGGEATIADVDVERAGMLRLALEHSRSAVVHGRVVGLAASGEDRMVFVRAQGEQGSDGGAADATGAFRLERVPTGPVRVWAMAYSADGVGRSSRVSRLELGPGSEQEILIEFSNDLVVSGTVSRDGLPVPGGLVSFAAQGGQAAQARTDANGYYSLVGLEPGLYEVRVMGPDLSYEAEYTLSGSTQIDIDATGAAVAGSVLDATSGTPIDGAEVSLWRADAGESSPSATLRTNAAGAFSSRSLREGAYRLLASKDGYGQELRELELRRGSAEPLALELSPSSGLSVQVVDARDGRPLDAVVVVRDSSRRIVANRHSGVRDDGSLTIPLAPGSYLLSTSATGYGTRTLAVSAPGSGVRVALTPGGTLVVESSRELRGRVRLLQPDGEEYVRCWCNGIAGIDLEGRRTTAANITPGSYGVELFDAAGRPIPAPRFVVIEEGRTSTLSVE